MKSECKWGANLTREKEEKNIIYIRAHLRTINWMKPVPWKEGIESDIPAWAVNYNIGLGLTTYQGTVLSGYVACARLN